MRILLGLVVIAVAACAHSREDLNENVFRHHNNLRWGRDMTRYARLTAAYEAVSTEAVNAALKKYLDLDKLVEVVAGSFAD